MLTIYICAYLTTNTTCIHARINIHSCMFTIHTCAYPTTNTTCIHAHTYTRWYIHHVCELCIFDSWACMRRLSNQYKVFLEANLITICGNKHDLYVSYNNSQVKSHEFS